MRRLHPKHTGTQMHMVFSICVQTAAWVSQKTASRLCKAALLLQYQQLATKLALLEPFEDRQSLLSARGQTTLFVDGNHVECRAREPVGYTAAPVGAGNQDAAEFQTYLQAKRQDLQYANQWRALYTCKTFSSWICKPQELESFSWQVSTSTALCTRIVCHKATSPAGSSHPLWPF